MREVFFNSFKEKILNGQVPDVFTVSGTPVTSDFFDTFDNETIRLDQYKSLDDFDKYANGNGTKTLEETTFKYEEYGVEYSAYYDNDVSEKPMFVNLENWDSFLQIYSGEIGYDDEYVKRKFDSYIYESDENVNSGFYYVQKKSQLKWISERCNEKENFNNRIVVVLGDDIGGTAEGYQLLDTVICSDPNRPFQGILDFNGHRVSNLIIECKENSNGIVGYLGTDGIVRDAILNDVRFKCSNKISLDKIRSDCSDVVVGGLVGTNYGRVENVVTSGDVEFNGFCPEVYLASNKYEYTPYDNIENNTNYNCFFPNKFCINSLYNVIPYVGYFCEGADSYFNDIADPRLRVELKDSYDDLAWNRSLWRLTKNNINALLGIRSAPEKTLLYYADPEMNYNLDHFSETSLGIDTVLDLRTARLTDHIGIETSFASVSLTEKGWPVHADKTDTGFADVFRNAWCSPMISMEDDQSFPDRVLTNSLESIQTFKSWNEFQELEIKEASQYIDCDERNDNEWDYGAYIAKQIRDELLLASTSKHNQQVTIHQKMNPYSRIAYYCSPVVGNNFGTIENIDCRHVLRESRDTFVGFIGNVCGKQNCGTIKNVNSLIDIAEADSSAAKLASRVYTENRTLMPEYPAEYQNMVNVFGYNWDYYQSPYGIDSAESEKYSETSASAVLASDKFYTFHDVDCSGVMLKKLDDHEYETAYQGYVFNRLSVDRSSDTSAAQRYCNFKLPGFDSEDSASIGNKIPESLRNAKLKLNVRCNEEYDLDTFSIDLKIPYSAAVERSTFKLYNPYDDLKEDNIYQKLQIDSGALIDGLRGLTGLVQHMDLSYLGDACKYLSENDPGCVEDEEDVKIYDVLNYCPSFSGECGLTKNNAIEFARNVMNAKVAVGCELLLNPSLNPRDHEHIQYIGTNNDDEHVTDEYVIPPYTGPNEDDEPMELGDDLPDFRWYAAPGIYEEDTYEGPKAFKPEIFAVVPSAVSYDSATHRYHSDKKTVSYNRNANYPNYFCSVNSAGYWDLCGSTSNDLGPWNEAFKNGLNYYETGIPKTMLSITPRDGDESIRGLGDLLASAAHENEGFAEIVGDEYEVVVNKISIPIANRTQNKIYLSESIEGLSDASGVYLDYRRQEYLWDYQRDESGQIVENGIILPRPIEDDEGVCTAGNLDYLYIDLSVIVKNEDHPAGEDSVLAYPMIVKMPISRLRLPISAVRVTSPAVERTVDKYSEDLANYIDGTVKLKERTVDYYHLVPAFDVLDRRGETIEYKLKSIYNVGGICGMINHCVSYAERGNYGVPLEYQRGRDAFHRNMASCGSIEDCKIRFTERTFDFIDRTLLKKIEEGKPSELNDRTISIANKFAGVAAIYEYRQNDVGTSPWSDIDGCGPDTLECLYSQKFKMKNIYVGGSEDFYTGVSPSEDEYKNRSLFRVFRKTFSPFIEWANVSNILDTTNFFLLTDRESVQNTYRSRHSSNFPIGCNIQQPWNVTNDLLWTGQSLEDDPYIIGLRHPVIEYGRTWPTTEEKDRSGGRGLVQFWEMFPVGTQLHGETTDRFFPRLRSTKTYHLMPSVLFELSDVWLYGDYEDDKYFRLHMSPVANAPCSEYNDVYLQMFGGNPNFVNRKLCKPTMNAPLKNDSKTLSMSRAQSLSIFGYRPENIFLLEAFQKRYDANGGITDRYFTWDYEMKSVEDLGRDKSPLEFRIRYGRDSSGRRGLWIHQNDPYAEDPNRPWIQYEMSSDGCVNDGSNVHLGYLPSERSIITLLNRSDENDSLSENQYEEGRAVNGEDFRGILLSDSNRELVCFIDAGYGHDLTSGCYVAQLPAKRTFADERGERAYGLLAEIKVES
jgi:hypothetical protein